MIWASKEFWEKFKQHPTLWKTHWYLATLKRQCRWKKQNKLTSLSFKEYVLELRK